MAQQIADVIIERSLISCANLHIYSVTYTANEYRLRGTML